VRRVSVTPLEVERAAYVWRLQCDQPTLDDRLADLQVAFRWLLQIHAGSATPNLVRARAPYVRELHAEKRDLDAEIAELAQLHHDLIAAELDRTSASCVPPRRRCRQRLKTHDPGATPQYPAHEETALG
jgi:hypothetical protein